VALLAAASARAAPPDAGVFVPGRSLGGVTLGWFLDPHFGTKQFDNGSLIDLNINFREILKNIQQIYNLTGKPLE